MYCKFTLILLFAWFGTFSQSVPNTTTFTLQNVVDVVGGGSNALVNSFSNAQSYFFDPTYAGSKNSLLNFRNYKGTVNSSIIFNCSGSGSSVQYVGGRYELSISTQHGYNNIVAAIFNASSVWVGNEDIISESGTLSTTLGAGYVVAFYVYETDCVVYSDPIDQIFFADNGKCDNVSCPPNYTAFAIYHMVDSGTFTGSTKAEANAARDAYGQAQADAATCECVYTGPPP